MYTPFQKNWPDLQMRLPSKRAKIHKTISLNVLYSLRVFSTLYFQFSHGRLTVADPECEYIFASNFNIKNFRSFQFVFPVYFFETVYNTIPIFNFVEFFHIISTSSGIPNFILKVKQ